MAEFLQITTADLTQVLTDLSAKLDDFSPVMGPIAALLVDDMEQSFDRQIDPNTGSPWQRLSDARIAAREAAGHWPGKILQVTGRLAASLVPSYGPTFALAGTNVVYARVMNSGATRGEFGATKYGVSIPWGDIPARRFAGLSADGHADLLELVTSYLVG